MRCQRNARPSRGARAIATSVAISLAVVGAAACRRTTPLIAPEVAARESVHDYLGAPSRSTGENQTVSDAPRAAWSTRAGKGPLGAPAVGDRVIALATVDRWLYLLDARTGAPLWRYHGDAPFSSGPLIAESQLYAAEEGTRGNVVAVSLTTGRRRWRATGGDVTSPLALADGVLYGVTQQGGFAFALDAATGHARWRRAVGPSRSGAIVVGGRVALTTLTDSLVVLDAATGRVERRTSLPLPVAAPLARVDDSTVVAASPEGALLALSLVSGRVLWRVPTGDPILGAPVVAGDTVYALTNGCILWSVPSTPAASAAASARADSLGARTLPTSVAATPRAPHTIDNPSRCTTVAAPALVRGGVLVATVGGELLYYDRAAHRTVWARQLRGELRHPPIVRNAQIVVAPLLGDVVGLR